MIAGSRIVDRCVRWGPVAPISHAADCAQPRRHRRCKSIVAPGKHGVWRGGVGPPAPQGAAEPRRERGPDRPRPERWGRYEGVQLAFSRFPGFEVRDESLRWEFESVDAVWEELTAPPGPLSNALECRAAGRVRDRLMALVNRHGPRDGDRVVLDVGYLLVLARKPAAWTDAGGDQRRDVTGSPQPSDSPRVRPKTSASRPAEAYRVWNDRKRALPE